MTQYIADEAHFKEVIDSRQGKEFPTDSGLLYDVSCETTTIPIVMG